MLAVENRIVFRMGKRVYLRPILKEDLPLITIWINDPEVTQFLLVSHPMSYVDEEAWLEDLHKRKETNVGVAIVLVETNEIIGTMGLHGIDHRNRRATTGSVIGRKAFWSKGYGTEAKMLLLEYAFNTLNLRKVCSAVLDLNGRSMKALEKCGYKPEGVLKEHIFRNGRYADEHLFAVFHKDFLPLWEKFRKEVLGQID